MAQSLLWNVAVRRQWRGQAPSTGASRDAVPFQRSRRLGERLRRREHYKAESSARSGREKKIRFSAARVRTGAARVRKGAHGSGKSALFSASWI